MRKHYLRKVSLVLATVFITNACQHFNESNKTVFVKKDNISKTKKVANSVSENNATITQQSEKLVDNEKKPATKKSLDELIQDSKYAGVFADFSDGEAQNKLRSELLMSLSKNREVALSHRQTKAERIKKDGPKEVE